MGSSDRVIGFSTGAIAKGDFQLALGLLRSADVRAVELSALREHELSALIKALPDIDLSGFVYVSVHAPTRLKELSERDAVTLLKGAASLKLPIVVHPDTIQTPDQWRSIESSLLIENMDKRKADGRTLSELRTIFEVLPKAGFCFDIAHARQVDPTMTEAVQMLKEFKGRLQEVHVSGVTTQSVHGLISTAASAAYRSVADLIPCVVPVILESPVSTAMIRDEIEFAHSSLTAKPEPLRAEIA
jgi:hypothetical protein